MRSAGLVASALMLALAIAPEPSPIRALAESIPGTVAAEFASDLLIRVADSTAAAKESAEWRADLYEQAFQLARSAQDPLPRYLRRDPRARSRVNPIGPAERLDTLSLQVRAFNALFELRRERSLALAGTLDVRIPTMTCSDALVPSAAGAFDIARRAYDLLEGQVLSVYSSTQLAPAFEAILAADLSTTESRALLTALATTMRSLRDDDVSFTDTLGPTWAAVKHAIDGANEESFSGFVLDAFRTYLVLHLSGERCASQSPALAAPSAESDTLTDIDGTLVNHDRSPLTRVERTASRTVPIAKGGRTQDGIFFGEAGLWQSKISKSLVARVIALRDHIQSGRPIDDRRSPEWHDRLSQLYAAMATWTRSDEPSVEDYLRERGVLLEMLVDAIPSGTERVRVLGDLLVFLKSEGRQLFGNNGWANRLRAMIDACRNSPVEWDWLLRALLDSGDPVMRLYAQLEQLPAEP